MDMDASIATKFAKYHCGRAGDEFLPHPTPRQAAQGMLAAYAADAAIKRITNKHQTKLRALHDLILFVCSDLL
jgi:hypothetical protein